MLTNSTTWKQIAKNHKLPKLSQDEIVSLNIPITIKIMAYLFFKFQYNKSPNQDGFTEEPNDYNN